MVDNGAWAGDTFFAITALWRASLNPAKGVTATAEERFGVVGIGVAAMCREGV